MAAKYTVTADSVPRLPRGVRLRQDRARNRWVMLAPERIFEVDETGLAILERCDGKSSVGTISAELARTYNADPDAVRLDVEAFLDDLREKRVLDL